MYHLHQCPRVPSTSCRWQLIWNSHNFWQSHASVPWSRELRSGSFTLLMFRDWLSWVTDVTILQGDWTGLLSTFILLFLPSSSVSLSNFYLAVPMRGCVGKHSCMSSPFPIAILNGTCFLRALRLFCGDVSAIKTKLNKQTIYFVVTAQRADSHTCLKLSVSQGLSLSWVMLFKLCLGGGNLWSMEILMLVTGTS